MSSWLYVARKELEGDEAIGQVLYIVLSSLSALLFVQHKQSSVLIDLT